MVDEVEEIKIEEQVIEKPEEAVNVRADFTLDKFMDDMSMLGTQVRNPSLRKPVFHYGDGSVTNYLLWLILAELMTLNDELKGDTE